MLILFYFASLLCPWCYFDVVILSKFGFIFGNQQLLILSSIFLVADYEPYEVHPNKVEPKSQRHCSNELFMLSVL